MREEKEKEKIGRNLGMSDSILKKIIINLLVAVPAFMNSLLGVSVIRPNLKYLFFVLR